MLLQEDILGGFNGEATFRKFGSRWMKPSPNLKYVGPSHGHTQIILNHITIRSNNSFIVFPSMLSLQIYVPLIDQVFHWYLMVVSLDECKVYKLDSFPDIGRAPSKQVAISNVVSFSSLKLTVKCEYKFHFIYITYHEYFFPT